MPATQRYSHEMKTGPVLETKPIFLVGATGVGKSAVALAWARQMNAAILAMDALQVYRGADIGTGKPTAAERAEIPHGGLDFAELGESFDVAQYLAHATAFLKEQARAGRPVIIVGGTGLYFRALTRGLCEAPRGSEELRAELGGLSLEDLQSRLASVDPEMLAKIDGANPRRVVRAIEVMETTGRSLLSWQAETTAPLVPEFTAHWLHRKREELLTRIDARVEEMFVAGWREEVNALLQQHPAETVQRFPGIGYREIAQELVKSSQATPPNLSLLKQNIALATRQYAKRQLTWFARESSLGKMLLAGPRLPEFPFV